MSSRHVLITTPHGLRRIRVRAWHRWIAGVRSLRLDGALASGRSPDTDRWLALRAATLLDPAFRERLAGHWCGTMKRVPHAALTVPPDVYETAPGIGLLIDRLRSSQAVSVRGVAHAYLLLTDGGSPLHHQAPAGALPAAIRACLRELDPAGSDYELSA